MADDIVTRLQDVSITNWDGDEVTDPLCAEAADEIERLRDQLWAARTGKALLQLEEANAEIERLQAENNAMQVQLVAQAIELLGAVHK